MSEELPYFKFFPSQWIGGEINYLSKEDKGAFIDAVCHYWNKNCSMTYNKLARRIGQKSLDTLLDEELLQKKGNQINIKFLDKQYKERKEQYIKRVQAAKKSKKTKVVTNDPYLSTNSINNFIKAKQNDS